MASNISGVFSEDLQKLVVESKVLVVGAGGIGCEILKNLVMSGFNDIEIIDLDTIDVSNLNRQFLFHKEHVGKSKAEVARESALNFNPDAKIKAYHDSITSTEYGVNFYKRFSLVMNALDNRAARNHVNRMCLAAKLPLIESGTQGYNGQVELIKRGLSQCYECQPKAAQKTFPGCTIRNTPSEPIHCIVWAKHLFNQLFGEYDDDEEVSPDTADPEAAGEAGAKAAAEESNDKGNVERVSTRAWAEECKYDPEKLFNKFFRDDITYLLSMHNLWKERQAPKPLVWIDEQNLLVEEPPQTVGGLNSQRLWSMKECQRVFMRSVKELSASLHLKPEGDSLVWDKDDEFAMDFVAACANIRAQIFGIELKTRFDIKSMAGNIIPAIATANAIVAGIVVLRAFRVLQDELEKCQSVYLRLNPNPNNHVIVPERALNQPNPNCYVCSPQPEVTLLVDTTRMTVKELEEQVLKKSLNMVAPDAILDSRQLVLISSEEGETEALNDKKLDELGVSDGSILKVDDFLQNYALTVIINHRNISKETPDFEVVYDATALKLKEEAKLAEPTTPVASTSNGSGPSKRPRIDDATEVDDDDDLEVIEDEPEQEEVSVKRKNDNDDEEFLHKKGKSTPDVANINPIETIDDDVMEIVSETESEKKEEVCRKRKSDGVLVKDQPKSDDVSQNNKKSTNEKDISSSDTAQANSISTAPDVANVNPIETIDDDVMEIVSETESEKKEEACRKRKSDGVLVKDQPKSDDVSQNHKQSTNEKDMSTLKTNANSVQTSDDDIIEIVSETESEKREEICRKYKTDTNITSPDKSQNHKQSDNCKSALDGDEPKPAEPSDNDIVEVMSETESEKTEEICRKRKTDVEDSSCKKRKTSEHKEDIVTLDNPDTDTV